MDNKSLLTSNGNSNRLPLLLKQFKDESIYRILNYGAGQHYKLHENLLPNNKIISYDPFVEEISQLPNKEKFDIVVCSNVLNVIHDDKELESILDYFDTLTNKSIYITVYEGNGTGIGAFTKIGTYQRNLKLKDWDILWKRGYIRIGKVAYKFIKEV